MLLPPALGSPHPPWWCCPQWIAHLRLSIERHRASRLLSETLSGSLARQGSRVPGWRRELHLPASHQRWAVACPRVVWPLVSACRGFSALNKRWWLRLMTGVYRTSPYLGRFPKRHVTRGRSSWSIHPLLDKALAVPVPGRTAPVGHRRSRYDAPSLERALRLVGWRHKHWSSGDCCISVCLQAPRCVGASGTAWL